MVLSIQPTTSSCNGLNSGIVNEYDLKSYQFMHFIVIQMYKVTVR